MTYIAGRKTTFDQVHILEEHAHGQSKVYPTLSPGVDVLSGIAWTLGNFVEIIPADTITKAFDIHWLVIETTTDDETYEMVFYAGEVEIARVRFATEAAGGNRLQTSPIPTLMKIQPPNTQIQAKMASSGAAETATISLIYHEY